MKRLKVFVFVYAVMFLTAFAGMIDTSIQWTYWRQVNNILTGMFFMEVAIMVGLAFSGLYTFLRRA